MGGLGAVLTALLALQAQGVIIIVRIKNRFEHPTPARWADAMVNLMCRGSEHVCELQLVHATMLKARKEFGGHNAYAAFREAAELLQFNMHSMYLVGVDDVVREQEAALADLKLMIAGVGVAAAAPAVGVIDLATRAREAAAAMEVAVEAAAQRAEPAAVAAMNAVRDLMPHGGNDAAAQAQVLLERCVDLKFQLEEVAASSAWRKLLLAADAEKAASALEAAVAELEAALVVALAAVAPGGATAAAPGLAALGAAELAFSACGAADKEAARVVRPLRAHTRALGAQRRVATLKARLAHFSLEDVRVATDEFSEQNKLLGGAFGAVFRGTLSDGRCVAIKGLKAVLGATNSTPAVTNGEENGGGNPMFDPQTGALLSTGAGKPSNLAAIEAAEELKQARVKAAASVAKELDVLGRVDHPNIFELVGHCDHTGVSQDLLPLPYVDLLVFESAHGNLENQLHGVSSQQQPLLWRERINIATDIACGLAYLHSLDPVILHQDVCSENIMLVRGGTTKALTAKVGGFGASRICGVDLHAAGRGWSDSCNSGDDWQSTVHVVGRTPIYELEYIQQGQVSVKTDAFAFGVVLLELLTGKLPMSVLTGKLLSTECFGMVEEPERCDWFEFRDHSAETADEPLPLEMASALATAARRCIDSNPSQRCKVSQVLPQLEAARNDSEAVPGVSDEKQKRIVLNSSDTSKYWVGMQLDNFGPAHVNGTVVEIVQADADDAGGPGRVFVNCVETEPQNLVVGGALRQKSESQSKSANERCPPATAIEALLDRTCQARACMEVVRAKLTDGVAKFQAAKEKWEAQALIAGAEAALSEYEAKAPVGGTGSGAESLPAALAAMKELRVLQGACDRAPSGSSKTLEAVLDRGWKSLERVFGGGEQPVFTELGGIPGRAHLSDCGKHFDKPSMDQDATSDFSNAASGLLVSGCYSLLVTGYLDPLFLGVAPADMDLPQWPRPEDATWQISCRDGSLWEGANKGLEEGGGAGQIKDGSVVSLLYDAEGCTLRFLVDGEPHGPGFVGLPFGLKLYLQASYGGLSVELLNGGQGTSGADGTLSGAPGTDSVSREFATTVVPASDFALNTSVMRPRGTAERRQNTNFEFDATSFAGPIFRGENGVAVNSKPAYRSHILELTSAQLRTATGNYNAANMLAEGSFGQVFKGHLPSHGDVVMKRLKSTAKSGESGFRMEALLLGKWQHANIVTLIGHCFEDGPPRESVLVFELMETGALSVCLRKGRKWPSAGGMLPLGAAERLAIASDVARALKFLHNEAKPQIIHQDVKTGNILLAGRGERIVAKLADFGTVREVEALQDDVNTHIQTVNVVGTTPYMPLEYLQAGQVSVKTDAYAFGIVLLELMTGKPAFDRVNHETLGNYMFPKLSDNRQLLLMMDDQAQWTHESFLQVATISHGCLLQVCQLRTAVCDIVPLLDELALRELRISLRNENPHKHELGQVASVPGLLEESFEPESPSLRASLPFSCSRARTVMSVATGAILTFAWLRLRTRSAAI
jgi:serine/threonine protein kinase